MIEIALFGGVSVLVDDVPISGEAAQRRRLAVLALLAVPALRPVSRDQLIGCLWPDHDEDSARHLLSSALHVLRRALGPDAVQGTVDEVALNPAVVRCDVAEFTAAIAAGAAEQAVALYRGDFLDGFFVSDAADFTQWVETERAELRRQYGLALEQAARLRQEAGEHGGAADAWRRRAALDPYDARVAIALMHALVAANQRTAALQHARVHAALLEQEFGSPPDPEVEALAAALRQAPLPQATSTPPVLAHPAPAAAAETPARVTLAGEAAGGVSGGMAAARPPGEAVRRWRTHAWHRAVWQRLVWRKLLWRRLVPAVLLVVLVSAGAVALALRQTTRLIGVRPFESVDTTLSSAGIGLAVEVAAELSRIRGVRLVARDLAFATRGMDARAANDTLDTFAVLDVRLVPPDGGGPYIGYVELVDRQGVNLVSASRVEALSLSALRELVLQRVAAALGRRIADPSPSLLAADSADPRAVVEYQAGRGDWYERTPASLESALAHFDAAVKIDSGYARGWLGLAETLALLGSYDYAGLPPKQAFPRAREAAERALRLDPSLADAHAALGLVYMNYYWEWDRAAAEFQRALADAEDRASAREWYALLLAARGRIPEARRESVRAAEQQTMAPTPLVQQAHILYYAGEYEQARADIARALERSPRFLRAHILGALIDLASGREEDALATLAALSNQAPQPEPVLVALLGYARARTGDPEGARAALQALRQAGQRGQYVPPELLALLHVGLGERAAALDQLERAYREKSGGIIYARVEPLMDDLRSEPRFQALVKAVHEGR